MKAFCLIIFIFILVSSCQKKFKANYTLNKYEYAAGDMIEYSNLTLKAKEYKWEIIDSEGNVDTTFLGTNPVIVSRILSSNGVYNLKLTATKGKKSSIDEKPFLLKTDKQYLNVNCNGPTGDQDYFSVYVDGQYIGKSTKYSSQNYGFFQVKIPEGKRIIKLVSSTEIYEQMHDVYNSVTISF